tara:strand:- start:573 stop:2699 length:2127 start_codon:yes stop_codon:yes gene_type:complete
MNMAQPPTPPNAPATPRPLMGASIPSDVGSHIEDLADTHTMEQLKQKNRIAPSTYNVLAMEKLQGEINATARELALAQAAKQQEDGITGTIAERKPAELRNSVDELNRILGAGAAPMQQPQGQPQMAAQGGIIGYSNGGGVGGTEEVSWGELASEIGSDVVNDMMANPGEYGMLLGNLGLSLLPTGVGQLAGVARTATGLGGIVSRTNIINKIRNAVSKPIETLKTIRKGDKGKGTTREDRGSAEKFDAERARLQEMRGEGPTTVPSGAPRPRSDVEVDASGVAKLAGREVGPVKSSMSRMKDRVSNLKDKLPSPKKAAVGAGVLGGAGYGLSTLLPDDLDMANRPDADKNGAGVGGGGGSSTATAGDDKPKSSFEILSKVLDEDQDFLTKGQQLSPKAEDRLGPMLDQYKKDAGISLSQVGAEASKDYLDRLGRDEKLEKVNEIFANYKESFEKLYSDEKLSRQRRMAAFSNATGDSVGQVLANMQKGFLATEKAQDAIIQAHLLKVAGHELKALEIDIQMFDKGEERAMAVQKIAAADRLEARRMLGEATREEKADYIKYANYFRDQNDTRINNWLRMVEQFAADFRATDERDLAEVSAAREFQASMLTLRQNGIRSYLNASDEYKELMETLQAAMLEGKKLFPAEQERLDQIYKIARMAVDLEIDAELRVKEQMAEETIAKYDQNRGLSATERALSALSEATNQT